MLHALPFTTFGEAAALGLEAHVYCPSCFRTRPVDPTADHLRDRCFATTRFRCHQCQIDRQDVWRSGVGNDPAG
jgi:transposase-like protein